jgi:hypothetical protein
MTVSRTDKDTPSWVLAEWWRPCHVKRYVWADPGPVCVGCELPDEPRVVNLRATLGSWSDRGCHWEPEWPYRYGRRRFWAPRGVPKWFVDHVWNNPERVRERDHLRALCDEYNTHRNLEDGDFPCWQTRSYARWMWD